MLFSMLTSTFRVIRIKNIVLGGLRLLKSPVSSGASLPHPHILGLCPQAPGAFGLKLEPTVSPEVLVYVSESGSQNLLTQKICSIKSRKTILYNVTDYYACFGLKN